MRLDIKFRHTPHSDELTEYVKDRCHKLEKFERKPVKIEFTFTAQKQTCSVDITVRGKALELHAHHESASFFDSVDYAIDKIARQMERKKSSRAHQRRTKPPVELPIGFQPEDNHDYGPERGPSYDGPETEPQYPQSDSPRKVS
jgi:ribosomal subunit interface protein